MCSWYVARALYFPPWSYAHQRKIFEARGAVKAAIRCARCVEDYATERHAWQFLGGLEYSLQNFQQAIFCFGKGVQVCPQLPFAGERMFGLDLQAVAARLQNRDEAFHFSEQAHQLALRIPERRIAISPHFRHAYELHRRHEIIESLAILQWLLADAHQLGATEWLGEIHLGLGRAWLALDLDAAEPHLLEAKRFMINCGSVPGARRASIMMMKLYRRRNRQEDARQLADEMSEISAWYDRVAAERLTIETEESLLQLVS